MRIYNSEPGRDDGWRMGNGNLHRAGSKKTIYTTAAAEEEESAVQPGIIQLHVYIKSRRKGSLEFCLTD